METYNDWLMHYGHKGMRWGIMNGPPYPINQKKAERLEARHKKLQEKKKIQDLKIQNDTLERQIKKEKEENKLANRSKRQIRRDNRKEAKRMSRIADKSPRKLSNSELNSALDRRTKENRLREEDRKSMGNGKAFAKQLIVYGGTLAAVTFTTVYASEKAKGFASSLLKGGK